MQYTPIIKAPTTDPEINAAISDELHTIAVEKAFEEDPYAEDDNYTVLNKLGEGVNYLKDKIVGAYFPSNEKVIEKKVIDPTNASIKDKIAIDEPRIVPISQGSDDIVVMARVSNEPPLNYIDATSKTQQQSNVSPKKKSVWDNIKGGK